MPFIGDNTTNIASWFGDPANSSPNDSDFPDLDDSLVNLASSTRNDLNEVGDSHGWTQKSQPSQTASNSAHNYRAESRYGNDDVDETEHLWSPTDPQLSPPPVSSISLSSPIPVSESETELSARVDGSNYKRLLHKHGKSLANIKSEKWEFDDYQWKFIIRICDYFDSNNNWFTNSGFDRADIARAALSLGFSPPQGRVAQFLENLGMCIDRYYSDSSTFWTDSANELKNMESIYRHDEFIANRRSQQAKLAASLETTLTQRKFLFLWKIAIDADVKKVKMLLKQYDSVHVKPSYFFKWRARKDLSMKMGIISSFFFHKRQLKNFFETSRMRLIEVGRITDKSKVVGDEMLKRAFLHVWTTRFNTFLSQNQLSASTRNRVVIQRVYIQLKHQYQCHHATRMCRSSVRSLSFQKWKNRLCELKNMSDIMEMLQKRAAFRRWRKKYNQVKSINDLLVDDHIVRAHGKKFMKLLIYQTKLNKLKSSICLKFAKRFFLLWRMKLRMQNCYILVTKIRASELFSHWRACTDHAMIVDKRLNTMNLAINQAMMSTIVKEWYNSLSQIQSLEALASNLEKTILMRKPLLQASYRLTNCDYSVRKSQKLQILLFKRKFYSKLKLQADKLRDRRLELLQLEASDSVIRKNGHKILSRWHQNAEFEWYRLSIIDSNLLVSSKRCILINWWQYNKDLQIAKVESSRMSAHYAKKQKVNLWRQAEANRLEIVRLAEDTEIALLGIFCLAKVRKWQTGLSNLKARTTEAIDFRERKSRNLLLSILQKWRYMTEVGCEGLDDESSRLGDATSDIGNSQSFYTVNDSLNWTESPSKLSRISPQLISKWKTGARTHQFINKTFPNRPLSSFHTPKTSRKPEVSLSDDRLGTPTKFLRSQTRPSSNLS